jgi:hypothetical protein
MKTLIIKIVLIVTTKLPDAQHIIITDTEFYIHLLTKDWNPIQLVRSFMLKPLPLTF